VSSLTEQERLGLEEVFLSISTHGKPMRKMIAIREKLYVFWRRQPFFRRAQTPLNMLFWGRKQPKYPIFHHLLPKKNKKKKNLS